MGRQAGLDRAAGLLLGFALALAPGPACGPAPAPAPDVAGGDAGVGEHTEPLAVFSVTAHASRLVGNAPIEIAFWVEVVGDVGLTDVAVTWDLGAVGVSYDVSAFTHTFEAAANTDVIATVTWLASDGRGVEETAKLTVDINDCADLALGPVTLAPPTEVAPGGTVTLQQATLRNLGDAVMTSVEVRAVLSDDDLLDEDDPVLGVLELLDGVASGALDEVELDLSEMALTIPQDAAPDTYFVFLVADPDDQVGECQEGNNTRLATNGLTVDTAASLPPDLVVADVAVTDGLVVNAGDHLTYSFTLTNIGPGAAGEFTIAAWASTDDALDPETDILLAGPSALGAGVPGMAPGKTQGFLKSWQVPPDLPDGSYHVIVYVDAAQEVDELVELNNVAVSEHMFTMAYVAPICFELALTELVVSPTASYWGGAVALIATVHNPGTLSTPDGWRMTAFFSPEATLNPVVATQMGEWTLPALDAGETAVIERVVPISDALPVGYHWVGLFIDLGGDLDECAETNNALLFDHAIHVEPTATVELATSGAAAFHPSAVVAGQDIKVTWAMINQGTSTASAFDVAIVLSSDPVVTLDGIKQGKDVIALTRVVPALLPAIVETSVDKVTIPVALDHAVGTWFVAAVVDPAGVQVSDKDKSNNVSLAPTPLTVVGPQGGCFEDPFEPNDTPGAATPLAPGGTGDLASCADEDWWAIAVPAGHSVVVSAETAGTLALGTPPSSDIDLELYVDGQLAATSDNTGDLETLAVFNVSSDAVVLLRVFGKMPGAQAHYALDVQLEGPVGGVDLRPNAIEALPPVLYPGGVLALGWEDVNVGDADSPAYGARVWLSTDTTLQTAQDVMLLELAQDGVPAQSAAARGAQVTLPTALPGGIWRALIELDPGGATGDVAPANNVAAGDVILVDAQLTCADDAFEPNDGVAIATLLVPVGGSVAHSGLVVCPQLEDWYAIELEEGEAFSATVSYAYDAAKGLVAVELWAPGGAGLLLAQTGKNTSKVTLPWVWASGTYLLRVRNQAQGQVMAPYTYSLTANTGAGDPGSACVADSFEPNDALSQAAEIGCGNQGATLCKGDVDLYRMELAAGQAIAITLTHGEGHLALALLAGSPPALLANQSGNGTLGHVATTDQVVWLRVEPTADPLALQTFDYLLHLDGVPGTDLIVSQLALAPTSVIQGEDTLAELEIQNACIDAAPATDTAFWLSLDGTLDETDVDLGVAATPPVPGKSSVLLAPKVTVPVSIEPGDYVLLAVADASGEVAESNEWNNEQPAALVVAPICAPDGWEPNDQPLAGAPWAPLVGEGQTEGLTLCPGELDWFAMNVPAGVEVHASITFDPGAGDLDLRLYDPAWSLVAPAVVSATSAGVETVSFAPAIPGFVVVRINGFQGASADYTLDVFFD